MKVFAAMSNMVIIGGAVTYGVIALTGNGSAGYAFGIAAGWFAYHVISALQK